MTAADIIAAWDAADPAAIHPSRDISEEAYWASGTEQAAQLANVLPAGSRVVDFGCGDGRVAIALRAAGFEVTGVDSSQRMLDRLADRDPDLPTLHMTEPGLYEQLGKKTDAVVCLAVLIHHTYAVAAELIEEMRTAVKANGLLVLDWPVSDTEPVEARSWLEVSQWPRQDHDALCARLGLKQLDTELPWGVYRAVKAA